MTIELFDIISYLESRGVEYSTSGKNVSEGWVNIRCLWCGDDSNHLGINLSSKFFNCWICGEKGPPQKLVRKIEDTGESKAREIIEEFQTLEKYTKAIRHKPLSYQSLPKESTTDFPDIHIEYLKSRNFDPQDLINRYDIRACYNLGRYKFRIIIPVIMNHKIVGFTSRDVTDKSEYRYKNCRPEEGVLPQSEWIYNGDSLVHTALIVEGPTDVWRMGDGAICMFGLKCSDSQVKFLHDHGVYRVFILYDDEPEAQIRADKIGGNLASVIPDVNILTGLGVKDPAKLSPEEAIQLKREIFDYT